jgi:hypothetical protein
MTTKTDATQAAQARESMKSNVVVRSLLWILGSAMLVSIPAASTSIEACGESGACTQLRSETYANKAIWDACDPTIPNPNDQCIFIPGNPKDCTGVLTCEFAVNRKYRADAELAVYNIGQQSQGCYLCAVPDCIAASFGYCEPVSRRCIVVTSFSNGEPGGSSEDSGSAGNVTPTGEDSGAPAPTPDGSTTSEQ